MPFLSNQNVFETFAQLDSGPNNLLEGNLLKMNEKRPKSVSFKSKNVLKRNKPEVKVKSKQFVN